ncbi:MAG: hypothetical protein KGL78_04175 [Burkholderiales bacterium]|nr:hypothetical protein [Burkholderiales bacterium]
MPATFRTVCLLAAAAAALGVAGCATRAIDVKPTPTNPAEFAIWSCEHIGDELEVVQKRAVDVAYAVDERGGNNIVALGFGLAVFWPALLAMRPQGLEADDLARLKGRYEALQQAARAKDCAPDSRTLPPARLAALPVAVGERLVYEDRREGRRGATPADWILRVTALRRDGVEYRIEGDAGGALRNDSAGNITEAPAGVLMWPHLLRGELALGQVVAGEIISSGDTLDRARVRGQVVALGPQTVAGRRFDAAVLDLFGDARHGDRSTRLDGALVIDRTSGFLLRLDLRSAQPMFSLQRRLMRIEPAAP